MVNEEHLARLQKGVEAWNRWQAVNRDIWPDLTEVDLTGADLQRVDLYRANLSKADLSEANLRGADLRGADLSGADLRGADLSGADLRGADLSGADLRGANLSDAILFEAKLYEAYLPHAKFRWANLFGAGFSEAHLAEADFYAAYLVFVFFDGADLSGAKFFGADLSWATFSGANLSGADLRSTVLVNTSFEEANLTNCSVHGISAWNVNLAGAQQSDLIITTDDEPIITVDNLEVAQFIYLLLHTEKIREVIDTVTSKAVLILGRFTLERKAVLDAIREELRRRNYLPILFDFEAPGNRDFTETISTLAHLARFIVADLTEPSSLPKELEAIVPTLAVPVQPILEGPTRPYSMFQDYWKYHWVLRVHHYEDIERLIASLGDGVISPAEVKVKELEETRKAITEELLKQRPI